MTLYNSLVPFAKITKKSHGHRTPPDGHWSCAVPDVRGASHNNPCRGYKGFGEIFGVIKGYFEGSYGVFDDFGGYKGSGYKGFKIPELNPGRGR